MHLEDYQILENLFCKNPLGLLLLRYEDNKLKTNEGEDGRSQWKNSYSEIPYNEYLVIRRLAEEV